jgi:hypothetical protein
VLAWKKQTINIDDDDDDLSSSLDVMAVMSGDVGCCAWFVDDRVGSFLFNMVWSEF